MRASIEVAGIFRAADTAYRATRAGHLSLDQMKVMSAIEHCRTAVTGGHVEVCTDCGHWRVAYNSCRNRPARRAKGQPRAGGSPNAKPTSCRSATSMSSSRWCSRRPHLVLICPGLLLAAMSKPSKPPKKHHYRTQAQLRHFAADDDRTLVPVRRDGFAPRSDAVKGGDKPGHGTAGTVLVGAE